MRFLIAGLGSVGRRHLRNLLALGQRDIVLYRTRRSTLPDDELEGLPAETDLQAALRRRPDAVVVANPTAMHLEVAIPAARAGCHLLIEKPISHTWQRVDELRAALALGGGRAMAAFQYRHHPGLQQVKRLVAAGAVGRPVSARAHYGDYLPGWHPWEDYRQSYSAREDLGGGVILTLCHPLDYLLWILGPVEQVSTGASRVDELGIAVDGVAEVGLRFTNGCLGSVHLDYVQRPSAHRLEIIGVQGTLQWDQADGAVRLFTAAAGSWQITAAPEGYERNDMFLAEMRRFVDLVEGTADAAPSLEEGLASLRLALAAREAASSGGTVRL